MGYIEAVETIETYLEDLSQTPVECDQCGKKFFVISHKEILSKEMVQQKDLRFSCNDHVNWDLILDPDFQVYVVKSKKIVFLDQEQIQESYFKTKIFLVDRLN